MKYEAVVWDIDGTIVDSEELHFIALKNFVYSNGGLLVGEYQDFIGKSLTDIIKNNFISNKIVNIKQAIDEINDNYTKLIGPEYIRPGVKEIIETIKGKKNLKQGCASNGEKKVVESNLKNTNLKKYIDVALSSEDVKNLKPNPEIYKKACRKLNIKPTAAIAIEDTELGVEAAKKAKMYVIAFPNKDTSYMDFSKADCIAYESNSLKTILFEKIGI